MSSKGVDGAIERIAADPDFAGTVLSNPSDALASFDLTEDERTSISEALAADLVAAGYEVQTFAVDSFINWGDVQFNNTAALGQFQGTFDRSQNAIVLLEMHQEG
jgi:hypothetical protein